MAKQDYKTQLEYFDPAIIDEKIAEARLFKALNMLVGYDDVFNQSHLQSGDLYLEIDLKNNPKKCKGKFNKYDENYRSANNTN